MRLSAGQTVKLQQDLSGLSTENEQLKRALEEMGSKIMPEQVNKNQILSQ